MEIMNKNLKKIIVPFIAMIIVNLGSYYLSKYAGLGDGCTPYVGILFVSGLLFGPYGAVGAALGNGICDLYRGLNIPITVTTEIMSVVISILAYKLWYCNFKSRPVITKPKLSDTTQVMVFIGIILLCGTAYSLLSKKLFYIIYPQSMKTSIILLIGYFINFVNSAFVFSIIGMWLSKYIDFIHIPEISEKKINEKQYIIIGILLIITTSVVLVTDFYINPNRIITITEILVIMALIILYIRRPVTEKIKEVQYHIIPERTMNIFLVTTLFLLFVSYIIASDNTLMVALASILPINSDEVLVLIFTIMDMILIIFFIPSMIVLRYIEKNVINPIVSFSQIEKFIKKGDTIESDKLIEVYSKYINENDEIGMLARSYTNLINYTNEYIENIQEIESEKQRIEAELNIAERIQKSNLPTESIENEHYSVFGFSQPAKEVGVDLYDYYPIDDENIAIIIGDASGKGVPAALLSTITQTIIKQILKSETDPSEVLYLLNNQLCENNQEYMFVTLWLGIYNKNTGVITFSNAGHNAPLIIKNNKFEPITLETGIILGVIENFEFVKEEIAVSKGLVLYTDGITDAVNADNKFYGKDNLIEFLNKTPFDEKNNYQIINQYKRIYKRCESV